MNKKANINLIMIFIIMFSVIMFIFLFSSVGVHQIISENIIAPTIDLVQPLVSSETNTKIVEWESFYALDFINYDIFFLVFVIILFGGTIFSAYKAEKLGLMSFFGYITVGMYIFFLALASIGSLSDWLFTNFFYNLFDTTSIDMPIIDFFINNVQIISFLWFLAILLVNQFNLIGVIKSDSDGGFVEE